jgi:hypothetical protein
MADMGHAVCAVGYVEVPGKAVRDGRTHAVFARGLIVHDDQRGPYRVLPLGADDIEHLPSARLLKWQQKILTVEDNVSHMFVPLPSRVFLRAENADIVVRDFIQTMSYVSDQIVKAVGNGNSTAAASIRSFFEGFSADRWIQRTYLTTTARYRCHISSSEMSEQMKSEIVSRALPHFIWVTELIDRSSKQKRPTGARPVVGHFVLNATSSTDYNNDLLIAQFPHFIVHRDVNPVADNGEVLDVPSESMVSFDTHNEHLGRTRIVT